IKGVKEGLLVTVGDGDWSEASHTLLEKLLEKQDFFRGARLVLQLGGRSLGAADLGKLRDDLGDLQINLWTVLSESALTENAAKALGLEVSLPRPQSALPPDLPPISPSEDGSQAILVDHTLRSGKSVRFPGHVIVLGDVNAGAEVVAGGNIIVWGRVRGTVQAGSEGDVTALICALDLAPTQLRIANAIATSPKRRGKPEPEIAKMKDGQIVAERWKPNEKG
ncbi:MAG TPA: septum site-determining protein MinC, partial [Anaerolineales bacterium]|nr:septum site-determining protein MinC [Anaerolineales bacterium]